MNRLIWSLNSRLSGWLSKRYVLRFESFFYIWSLLNKPNQIFICQLLFLLRLIINFLITSQPILRSLPAAHHEEVCDYYEQRRELPLPVYHNFSQFYRRFLTFITAQYINPPSTPPTVL